MHMDARDRFRFTREVVSKNGDSGNPCDSLRLDSIHHKIFIKNRLFATCSENDVWQLSRAHEGGFRFVPARYRTRRVDVLRCKCIRRKQQLINSR